jgi:HAD superfamily hydrolase (TIGR01509 family)
MRLPRKPEGVIFDMDGLLIDTIPIYIQAMTAAGADVGHQVPRDYLLSLIGLLGQELQNRLTSDFGQDFPVQDFLQVTGERLTQILSKGAPLKKGAVELIEHLHSLQIPMAVATSMKKQEAEHQLELSNLRHLLVEVVGRDNVELSKPHPDLYLKAASHLQLQPGVCVALEDSFNGIKSAHSAGCMTIMVPDVLSPTAEIGLLCVEIASDLHEVKALFPPGGGHVLTTAKPGIPADCLQLR